ncbi:hypothetical protein [Amycolatopsis sp. WQ 127309]|uniref:hypothetical protein n=1 Tax=Amycolatopsis sp. WQ 127309 TaxID=2932773 RepID=UPI001FF6D2AF|nr:hypothetical protein [Amycolatopsis sp. WQ 127309]UOZ03386.1 hypothetical protein MUY22_31590 [Amycolatopsis sp. WQ 127309]
MLHNESPQLDEVDPWTVDDPECILLRRVLAGLHRMSTSARPPVSVNAPTPWATAQLVEAIQTTQTWIGLLAVRLQDGTASRADQRWTADKVEELLGLLQSPVSDAASGL